MQEDKEKQEPKPEQGIFVVGENKVRYYSNGEACQKLRNIIVIRSSLLNVTTLNSKKIEQGDAVSIRRSRHLKKRFLERYKEQSEEVKEKWRKTCTDVIKEECTFIGLWFKGRQTTTAEGKLPQNPEVDWKQVWNYLRLPIRRIGQGEKVTTHLYECVLEIEWDEKEERYYYYDEKSDQDEILDYRPVEKGLPILSEERLPVPWEVNPKERRESVRQPDASELVNEAEVEELEPEVWDETEEKTPERGRRASTPIPGERKVPPKLSDSDFESATDETEGHTTEISGNGDITSDGNIQGQGENQVNDQGENQGEHQGGEPEPNQENQGENQPEVEHEGEEQEGDNSQGDGDGDPGNDPPEPDPNDVIVIPERRMDDDRKRVSLKDYPTFDPDEDVVGVFLDRLNTILMLNNYEIGQNEERYEDGSEEERRRYTKKVEEGVDRAYIILRAQTTKDVQEWVATQKNPGLIPHRDPVNGFKRILKAWRDLVGTIKIRWAPGEFTGGASKASQRNKWARLKRAPNETYSQFLKQLERLSKYAGKDEDDVMDRIKQEVDDITSLAIENCKTLEELREALATRESRLEGIKAKSGMATFMVSQERRQVETLNYAGASGFQGFQGKCRFCRHQGHKYRECPTRADINTRSPDRNGRGRGRGRGNYRGNSRWRNNYRGGGKRWNNNEGKGEQGQKQGQKKSQWRGKGRGKGRGGYRGQGDRAYQAEESQDRKQQENCS